MTRDEFAAMIQQQEKALRETPGRYRCPVCGSYDCDLLTMYYIPGKTPESALDEQVGCQTCSHVGTIVAFTAHKNKEENDNDKERGLV